GTATIASAAHGPANVTSLAIDRLIPTTVYAGTSDRGVLKSLDGAVSWTPTGLTSSPVTALAIDPATPDILYAGTADLRVLKSIDGGANWASTGLSGVIETLAIDPGTPSRLYSVVAGMGAFKSEDGGEHWSLTNPTRSDGTTDLVRALAIDFTPPECPPCIYA